MQSQIDAMTLQLQQSKKELPKNKQEVVQNKKVSGCFKEGKCLIVPRNQIDKRIGEGNIDSYPIMVLQKKSNNGQVWEIKQVKNGQFCIFYHHNGQQHIVAGDCWINRYQEEEKQEEDASYRWVIEKRGNDEKGQQLYSIRNVKCYNRMNYDDNEDVILADPIWRDSKKWQQ